MTVLRLETLNRRLYLRRYIAAVNTDGWDSGGDRKQREPNADPLRVSIGSEAGVDTMSAPMDRHPKADRREPSFSDVRVPRADFPSAYSAAGTHSLAVLRAMMVRR